MSPESTPTYTWQELAKHNIKGDLYVAYRGGVYDVTKFLSRHPGGVDQLLIGAGRDITHVFDSYHQSTTAETYMKKYYIGQLITNEFPIFPPASAFEISIRKQVDDMFESTGRDPKNVPGLWTPYIVIIAIMALGYFPQFYSPFVAQYSWLQFFFAVVLGFGGGLMTWHHFHDAAHFCITHNPLVWKSVAACSDFLIGSSGLVWVYHHVIGHHTYTNMIGADPDASVDMYDRNLRRIHPDQPWTIDSLSLQPFYIAFLYMTATLKLRFADIQAATNGRVMGGIRLNPLTTSQKLIFWGGKLFWISHRLFVPLLISSLPPSRVLALFAVAEATQSWVMIVVAAVNHVVEDVVYPQVDEKGVVKIGWAEAQAESSQDFAHGSWLWTNWSGGLNYQVPHHLFPSVHQDYCAEIATILVKSCKEHGVKYVVHDSMWVAIKSHFAELGNLGVNPHSDKKKL